MMMMKMTTTTTMMMMITMITMLMMKMTMMMIWSYFLQPPTWVTWSESPAANLKSSSQGARPPSYSHYVDDHHLDHHHEDDHGDDIADDNDEGDFLIIMINLFTVLL